MVAVLRSGWVTQGAVVADFENAVADWVGSEHAVAVTSATTALMATLMALGVSRGDEVICPSFTYIATPNSIVHAGATPVFVDIDRDTWSLDPAAVEDAITPRTVAVMAVHQSYPAHMHEITKIAQRHQLAVIEDAAPGLGAHYATDFGGQSVGNSSGPVIFSFHPRKILTTGEGGMITTNDAGLAERLRLLRHHFMGASDVLRHTVGSTLTDTYDDVGYNLRMTDIQGAIGVAQMRKLDDILSDRARVAETYDDAIKGLIGVDLVRLLPGAVDARQFYALRLNNDARRSRDEVMAKLERVGIRTKRGIMSSHLEKAYTKRQGIHRLPETEDLSTSSLLLPLYGGMAEEDVAYVRDQVVVALTE